MAVTDEKDIQQLKKRLIELADKAYSRNIYTYTPFLGLAEQQAYYAVEREVSYAGVRMEGGVPLCERKIIRFGDPGYEEAFPIVRMEILPRTPKFAENLTHRDFLGSVMNLGIERSTIGDIKVGESQAYLFCLDSIAGFICENLSQVRHTHVKCEVTDTCQMTLQEEPELVTVQVQSLRVDAVLAKVYSLSREKSLDLFRAGKVFVGGRLCENNSRLLKPGETVNARGYGKFTLQGEPRETKKGKLSVETAVYR